MRSRKGRNQTEKKSNLLIYTGLFLIILSTGFLIYQKYRLESQKKEAIRLENLLAQAIEHERNQEQEGRKTEEQKGNTTISINASVSHEVDGINLSAIGVIRIDKIGIVLPIMDNASNQSLIEGAGIVEGTDLPSSKENTITVLAGHRGGRNENQTFLNIDQLEQGDEIKITTKEEMLYYKVVEQEIIEPNDWSKFTREEGKTKLFLMSCHPYPQNYQRLLMKAELIKYTEEVSESLKGR